MSYSPCFWRPASFVVFYSASGTRCRGYRPEEAVAVSCFCRRHRRFVDWCLGWRWVPWSAWLWPSGRRLPSGSQYLCLSTQYILCPNCNKRFNKITEWCCFLPIDEILLSYPSTCSSLFWGEVGMEDRVMLEKI